MSAWLERQKYQVRPKVKSGPAACAVSAQMPVLSASSEERSPLALPAIAVSPMRGKKVASAWRRRAFAVTSCCSASSRSGRRSSSSDGTPTGISGGCA